MDTLAIVQEELLDWTSHNFKNRTPVLEPLLGISEEIGEILTAYLVDKQVLVKEDFLLVAQVYLSKIQHLKLKSLQGIRGTPEYHLKESINCLRKLLACLEIYAGDSIMNLAVNSPVPTPRECIDFESKDTIQDGVSDLLVYTCNLCNDINIDASESLRATWNNVKTRDFQKFPKNGKTE